jgi:hypothetical protein
MLLGAVFGCSDGRPDRVPISGQVLIDGKPLAYGYVQFVPENARASQGKLDAEGRFSLSCFEADDGAVVGSNQIAVTSREPIGGLKVRWHAPKKYADYATSGLSRDVAEATDSMVIELTWAGGKPFVEVAEGSAAGEVEKHMQMGRKRAESSEAVGSK